MCGNDPVEKESFVSVSDVDVIFVEKDCNDWLVAAADDDCGWWDVSNIGVDVDVDWSITDKVGGSVEKWYLDEIVIEDNSVDGIVLVFADVANSDVVSVVTKEEEGSICGDWLIVADVDWRRSEDSDVELLFCCVVAWCSVFSTNS